MARGGGCASLGTKRFGDRCPGLQPSCRELWVEIRMRLELTVIPFG